MTINFDTPTTTDSAHGNTFPEELGSLLNRYSAEAPSGTPDYILASFLTNVLKEFNEAVSLRAQWRGETVQLPALIRSEAP